MDTRQRHVAVADHTIPWILLSVFFFARVELPFVLFIVLLAQGNLSLTLLMPLLNCGRARIPSILFLGGFLHYARVNLLPQLLLLHCCLCNNLFFLLS